MEVFLVGGAVRDKLLNQPITERDWVVVGATEEQLVKEGYTRVGKDFPVFLHPETKEEYALARTERKTGEGHRGFACDANENVSLEEDLLRRDLTVNAIAESTDGRLIDPYDGLYDLKKKVLRHVSSAFEEDPLRVLRVARFAARFPDFAIHPSTEILLRTMIGRGDLLELPAERIYAEIDKALGTDEPLRFFITLNSLGASEHLWPEITDKGIKLAQALAARTTDKAFRFTAILWPNSTAEIAELASRLKIPNHISELALLSCGTYETWSQANTTKAHTVVEWFYLVDAFRRPARFLRLNTYFSMVSEALGVPDLSADWKTHFDITRAISARDLMPAYSGPALGKALRSAQVDALIKSERVAE
ncbi:MAG: multifunctional CCA tRNA nucleotidyl transferase/2'3'-cyclic phosphodiesterase/2'nucleotidase/phosphatase [bacterium]|nr:multifunctional CCA tRNA nucleotidyl transferase/2'3'-cyclic phosphodiesterase/2'nucleotidase/phosphatase [Gammaproteobacteria bacterium]HIL95771.1 multifunctional CCA tRNA nucleotidyl transferase/2'3'-cyclic phosphodiesterase/2'nucleotidase/phosphatase [Pseudomonadales bacterium]